MSVLTVLFWVNRSIINDFPSLVASMATDKNVTVTGSNKCYYCDGSNRPDSNQDCWDESKLNQEKYQCTGKLILEP